MRAGCPFRGNPAFCSSWNAGSVYQCRLNHRVVPFTYVRVTAVRRERLGEITEDDAWKESYPSVEGYREAFERIYGFWNPDVDVWMVEFELV
ncbi:ASCH domain-containing protein [Desulfofundulus sp. TPOSR]|uniref:ASCH domain-containing protein n=1 Tax=Desulfofundulus sp. TPOSR TaxID=2714340 RepID=UPI00140752F0|nr:ASCH domain-containing protein [Desulfofundulus sp. TPOSR]MDK2889144.1 hypothetical protein [Thermoanaerobacter sp.]NHM27098.1 ASCH domain-containing protein [Desulfofundulus sp. TPOSR]